jgi:hypothetical protein
MYHLRKKLHGYLEIKLGEKPPGKTIRGESAYYLEEALQAPIFQGPSIIDILAPEIPPFMLDGQVIIGKQAQILHILTSASKEKPVNNPELLDKIFPSGEEEISFKKLSDLKKDTIALIEGKGLVFRHVHSERQTSEDSEPEYLFTGYYIEAASLNEPASSDTPVEKDEERKSYVDGFIERLPKDARALLTKVRQSDDFRFASELFERNKDESEETFNELRSNIAGYLFETVAYLYLKEKLKREGKILLSPQESFELFHLLIPEKEIIEHPFGLQFGIEGVSVPDGIVLIPSRNSTAIEGSCEYTLTDVDESGDKVKTLSDRAYRFDRNMNNLESKDIVKLSGIVPYLKSLYQNINDAFISPETKKQYIVLPARLTIPSEHGTHY